MMTLCSNVAQAGFLKEPAQSGGRSLQRPQMAQDVAPELRRRLQQALADPMRLQMIPDELIGVEFRGVRRQEEQPQAAVGRLHEVLHSARPVGGMLNRR